MDPDCNAAGKVEVDPTLLADLRLRLQGSRTQEMAARAEARRLARELVLTRRLLKFSFDGPSASRMVAARESRPSSTVLLSCKLVCHLDVCENRGIRTAVSGWAFCPTDGWDARLASITLILRDGDTAYMTTGDRVMRPDIAAHYATQPAGSSGGALGLEGAGFSFDIHHDLLPAGLNWKLFLRLECEGVACEQYTGRRLRQ